ncbi:tyrosine-type recombinase/integrase [Weissella paramesenteroides]|uniref:tyrosine-type recombinase/integrase n=1 Tax=Weissella paramesenteroides TaxID=1249 RepID=UPI003F746237
MKAYIAPKNAMNVIWPGKQTYMDFNVPERWLQRMRKELPKQDNNLKHVSLHGLRHTHATLLVEQVASQGKAAPIKAVQKRLGHADVVMTLQIYTHATNKEDEIIDEILDTGFN